MKQPDEQQRGQSMAELALVLPLLLMILVSMVEVGWAMRAHLTVTTASREGARFGSRRVFSYEEIEEVTEVAMGALNPIFDGADANATIIITKVLIPPFPDEVPPGSGNYEYEIDGGAPYVAGDLAVSTRVDAAMLSEMAHDNLIFNTGHGTESEEDVVIVEVFYDHDLLLGSRIGSGWVGLGPLRLYSRSINRIGVSRYE